MGDQEPELPGMLELMKNVKEQKWPHTTDARVWVEEFRKVWACPPELAEQMLGWFANAIMAGYDTAQLRAGKHLKDMEVQLMNKEKQLRGDRSNREMDLIYQLDEEKRLRNNDALNFRAKIKLLESSLTHAETAARVMRKALVGVVGAHEKDELLAMQQLSKGMEKIPNDVVAKDSKDLTAVVTALLFVLHGICPNDTDGDGNCGKPACPYCGVEANKHSKEPEHPEREEIMRRWRTEAEASHFFGRPVKLLSREELLSAIGQLAQTVRQQTARTI